MGDMLDIDVEVSFCTSLRLVFDTSLRLVFLVQLEVSFFDTIRG